jgi:hypothetical protein
MYSFHIYIETKDGVRGPETQVVGMFPTFRPSGKDGKAM